MPDPKMSEIAERTLATVRAAGIDVTISQPGESSWSCRARHADGLVRVVNGTTPEPAVLQLCANIREDRKQELLSRDPKEISKFYAETYARKTGQIRLPPVDVTLGKI